VFGYHDKHGWPAIIPYGMTPIDSEYASNPIGVETVVADLKIELDYDGGVTFYDWWNWHYFTDFIGDPIVASAHNMDPGANWWCDDDDWTSWTDMKNNINNYGPMLFIAPDDYVAYYYNESVSDSGTVNWHSMCMYGYYEDEYHVNATAKWMVVDTGWSRTSPAWINYDASGDVYTVELRDQGTPTGVLMVSSPNGGESWQRGTSHYITWDSAAVSGNVSLELYKGGSYDRTITSSTSNDGSYLWSIPPTLATGSNYKVKITSTSDSSVYDYSNNYFTIVLPPDTTPPTPNPMTWSTSPYATGSSSISMTASTASDSSGVEYYFDETSGNPGSSDSGWQDSRTYTDTGLQASTTYTYRVRARDKSPNQNVTYLQGEGER
jgi:hypothetical protein